MDYGDAIMTRFGSVWQGAATQSRAGHGSVRSSGARYSKAVKARCGRAGFGEAGLSTAVPGLARFFYSLTQRKIP